MQGRYLYRTALARNVLPFALVNPPLIALPLVRDDEVDSTTGRTLPGKLRWRLLSSAELTARGDIEAAQWFGPCEKLWGERRSDSAKNQNSSMTDWLNWQNKLTDQPVDAKWAVMYTASATDASACVLDVTSFKQRFMVDYTMYVSFTKTEDEARFIEAFLNSGYANHRIKEFQARGLFGPRHVSKKILDIPWPEFSFNQPSHRRLIEMGHRAAQAVQGILGAKQNLELDPRTLGRLRSSIRRELGGLMSQIDALVESISTGRDLQAQSEDWSRLTHKPSPVGQGQSADELSEFLRAERNRWTERELLSGGNDK
jgi:hypothetical protein